MGLFNFLNKKTEIKAPLNVFDLIEKLKKSNLLLKHSEIANIDKNGIIKTQKPIKSNKQISIKLFDDNKSFPLKKFKVIDEHTIQIKKRDPVFWKIINKKRQYMKKVKVDYLTENKNDNYKMFIKKGVLYIKASVSGHKYCIKNIGALKDEVGVLIFDTKSKHLTISKRKKMILEDVETKTKYLLTIDKRGNLKLVPQI